VPEDVSNLLTRIAALYAAILSTVIFLLHLASKRTRLRVSAWLGRWVGLSADRKGTEEVVITITNTGEVDALVCALGMVRKWPPLLWRFRGRWRKQRIVAEPQRAGELPRKLSPAEQMTITLAADQFLASLPHLRKEVDRQVLCVADSRSKYHYSRRLPRLLPREALARYQRQTSQER